jgi:DNA-binding transcriptional LysR family regulator
MDIKDLRFFVAVYETRGFSSASQLLGTVQSNVSTRISGLEEFLGVDLFVRRYRTIEPTKDGDKLYPHAKEFLATLDVIRKLVSAKEDAPRDSARMMRPALLS